MRLTQWLSRIATSATKSPGTGLFAKRMKGLEPSTFCMANE